VHRRLAVRLVKGSPVVRLTAAWIAWGLLTVLPASCVPLDVAESAPAAAEAPRDAGASGAENDARAAGPDPRMGTPAIEAVVFVPGSDGEGPVTRVRGQDPGATLAALRVELLGNDGRPAAPEGEEATLDLRPARDPERGPFLVEIRGSPGLEGVVHAVAVTPIDAFGRPTARLIRDLAPLPVRAAGAACDPRGFDACTSGTACLPGVSAAPNVCADVGLARAGRVATAPFVVVVGMGAPEQVIYGATRGASLWDPPIACVGPGRSGRPEALVRLRVAAPLASLRIETAASGTTFDTVLSVLRDLDDAPPIACNDDDGATAPASALVLEDVAPGDVLVVVDGASGEGSFELHIAPGALR
jgi:hypothetical protein